MSEFAFSMATSQPAMPLQLRPGAGYSLYVEVMNLLRPELQTRGQRALASIVGVVVARQLERATENDPEAQNVLWLLVAMLRDFGSPASG